MRELHPFEGRQLINGGGADDRREVPRGRCGFPVSETVFAAYAAQANGAKWPLLPLPARARLRPKPKTRVSFA